MYARDDEEDALGAEALVSLQFHDEPVDLAHAEEVEREQRGWMSGSSQHWGEVPIMEADEEIDEEVREVIRDFRFA